MTIIETRIIALVEAVEAATPYSANTPIPHRVHARYGELRSAVRARLEDNGPMEQTKLEQLAIAYVAATEELRNRREVSQRYTWTDSEYKAAFALRREQEYEVSKLYKEISAEKTRLWREANG